MSDLISRSGLKEKSRRCFVDGFYGSGIYGEYEIVLLEDITLAPAVDAVPVVHGRWIMRGGKLYCSSCQQRAGVARDSDDFWYTKGTDYCPNCGARMYGERKNNDQICHT